MQSDDDRVYHAIKTMNECGFTDSVLEAVRKHRMAGSITEAVGHVQSAGSGKHWTETATPEQLAGLEAARSANQIIAESRAAWHAKNVCD